MRNHIEAGQVSWRAADVERQARPQAVKVMREVITEAVGGRVIGVDYHGATMLFAIFAHRGDLAEHVV
jgi:hypothetical protein